MKLNDLFISNMDEYKVYSDLINDVVETSINLPANVFRDGKKFLFEDFDWVMTEEFSEKLKLLALETNEPFVLVAVLDPNPVEYYYKEFGYFNWIKVPTNFLNVIYFEALMHSPEESFADSILYNSKTVVWTVPSAKWAIWGDRDFGTCILGFREACQINSEHLDSWKTVEDALEMWIKLSFRNQNVPKDFKRQMISNYHNAI